MTAKERVLCTMAHQEPDRVPLGEFGIDHDHVEKILGHHTYWRNRKDTTLALWDNRRDEVVESLKQDGKALVEALNYDIITVETVPPKSARTIDKPKLIAPGVWQDSKGTIYKYAASNDSIQCMSKPEGKYEITEDDIARARARILGEDDSIFEVIDFFAELYGGKRAILCRSIEIYHILFSAFEGSYDHNLVLTLTSPNEIKKLYPLCIEYNQRLIDHCAKVGVDLMMQHQDFGMNTGCIIRPDSFREIFAPVMKSVNDYTKNRKMHPVFHCCGNIWDILDDYVAAGYEAYQSIQESASMDNAKVKTLYGKQLTLWTGIQCETLVSGSLQDTQQEVLRNLQLLMPGGGFIFGSTNSVQYGAKTENYLKALELLAQYGNYSHSQIFPMCKND